MGVWINDIKGFVYEILQLRAFGENIQIVLRARNLQTTNLRQ